MKIGILSGTFDPVHDGHTVLAHTAIQSGLADEVWFLPEKTPRQKQNVSSYEHRLAMLRLAVIEQENMKVAEAEQSSHNLQTLLDLAEEFPDDEFVLLVGADVLLNGWDGFEQINKRAEIKTFGRAGMHADITFNHPASSKTIREQIPVSGEPENINPKVLDYIDGHGLYKS